MMEGDLGGTCPESSSNSCTGNHPTWTPNGDYYDKLSPSIVFNVSFVVEPIFWLHHAVSGAPNLRSLSLMLSGFPPQMIDKVWHDWQNANPKNFWQFVAGTVSGLRSRSFYEQYPSGGPPMLSVSDLLLPVRLYCSLTLYVYAA